VTGMGKARKKRPEEKEALSLSRTTLSRYALITHPLAALSLIAVIATLIYSNTFSASFHFDDVNNIVNNPTIKSLSNFVDFSGTRYIGFLSFALNYHFGGLNVFGYHLVNLLIHITNGFLVYSLVLLLFKASESGKGQETAYLSAQTQESASTSSWIALATALLFVAHPIQTQAVTYIVQRFASLAALFYLSTVVCYLKWRLNSLENRSRYFWYAGALVSTILAMKTKENTFTLPFMLVLVELVFFRPLAKKSWIGLIPFLLTLPIIPLSSRHVLGEAEAGFAQETIEISRPDYLFTQFRVILTYLRLFILPIHQNLDYDYPIYHSLFELPVFLSFLFLLSLFGLAVFLLLNSKRRTQTSQLMAFGILWFFLTLSIESSIIPIRDVIFEHRLYLPSVGFFLVMSVAIARGSESLRARVDCKGFLSLFVSPGIYHLAFFLIVTSLSIATYQRNFIWKDGFTIWTDVINKSPEKARAHLNLGIAYRDRQRFEEAFQEHQIALKLKPNYIDAHISLGLIYQNQGRLEEAIRELQMALKLKPDLAEAHINLGLIYQNQGRLEEAIRELQIALKLKPDLAEAHINLGLVYQNQGRLEEAIRELQIALKLKPDLAEAHINLGIIYKKLGRLEEAIREFQLALSLKSDLAEAYYNLGNAYTAQGRIEEAIPKYQTALKLKPDDADTHNNLGQIYRQQGRIVEAKEEFKRVLEIKPDYPKARQALEKLQNPENQSRK
jgi:tetratricopeptide (TPR) repeat protein